MCLSTQKWKNIHFNLKICLKLFKLKKQYRYSEFVFISHLVFCKPGSLFPFTIHSACRQNNRISLLIQSVSHPNHFHHLLSSYCSLAPHLSHVYSEVYQDAHSSSHSSLSTQVKSSTRDNKFIISTQLYIHTYTHDPVQHFPRKHLILLCIHNL